MNKAISIALTSVLMTTTSLALAEVTVYGRANLSFEWVNEGERSTTELVSNASRLGFKGQENIHENLQAIYQVEYEVSFDDGDKSGQTFSQRDTYVGLQGDFGQVIAGHINTPLKVAQYKVDLFNDLRGDMKTAISKNDNRERNSVQYTTPSMGGTIAKVALISSEVDGMDDMISTSVTWRNDDLYLAAAYQHGEKLTRLNGETEFSFQKSDTVRLVAHYTANALQLGALYEVDERDGEHSTAGWLVSAQYDVAEHWVLKSQYGQSDQIVDGADTLSLGADYKLNSSTKVFTFYTTESADDGLLDNDYLGLGLEHRF